MKTIKDILINIGKDPVADALNMDDLLERYTLLSRGTPSETEKLPLLIRAASELVSAETSEWAFIAARLLSLKLSDETDAVRRENNITSFSSLVTFLVKRNLYGTYITDSYSLEELDICASYMDSERDRLFDYAGLRLLSDRYLIRDQSGILLERPQEMFLGIALHLAMNEKTDRLKHVREFYDMLSLLKVTMATPTLSNARRPFHQLSSCFIDTVPDSLDGIYRSIDNFAKVSKFGGGMGLYFGKVRAQGSSIRGFEGAAGGVIRWIRLANDTAVAVDQLGVRQGACACYLDAWHRDLPEFLQLRTNNGDERMKAHDIFPAVCFPNYFWEMVENDIEGNWHLMCPHEILSVKGYALEDSWGDEWKEKYLDCVKDARIQKRTLPIKEIVRLMIRSSVETGTPFIFNRDSVNRMNPNPHRGMIYASNLCTEIAQNMAPIEKTEEKICVVDGEEVIVTVTRPGEFVVCNLASLSLGRLNVTDDSEMENVIKSAVRALDNVIDLNFFPVPYAKVNNSKYRPIGLGVSGYHHMLAKREIDWERPAHLEFIDDVFERIHYYTLKASLELAKEKGSYPYFEGSDFETGAYFEKRDLGGRFESLKKDIHKCGLRNGYLLAVAPTSSTSIIAGTTAGLDPIMHRFFLEEKKNGLVPRVAPDLDFSSWWYYKSAHLMDQSWSVKACGRRQKHIDQAQSMNLYITEDYTFRKLLELWLLAWREGVKTIYYTRSQSLEVTSCDSCSA